MRADATCYRHPDRRASVSCQRCNRPICTECMIEAPIGFQCPEDAKQGKQKVYTSQALFSTNARNTPVTFVLIAINLAVFVAGVFQGGSLNGASELTDKLWLFGPYLDVRGEWYRLVTSGFVHANLFHLGVNMWSLYVIGPQLERLLGSVRFAVVYLFCLLCGSLGVLLLSPTEPTLGASGAIFGLMGVLVILHRVNRVPLMSTGLGSVLILNLVLTFGVSYISVGGHIGGLIGGLVADRHQRRR